MRTLLQPLIVIVLFVMVRSGDLAIMNALSHSIIRAICYGIVAVLALLIIILTLFGL